MSTTQDTLDDRYAAFVRSRKKSPNAIMEHLDAHHVDLIHMVLGISGEAGELLDAVKKSVIYAKQLDTANIVEEMGDIEFYLEGLRQAIGWTREDIIEENIAKLSKRYKKTYTDHEAAARSDKR